jgi:hypothetical protein
MRNITREQQAEIVTRIRSGSYPHVAAESVGVPRRVFDEWMSAGRKQRRGRRRDFCRAVSQALAEIRAAMEIAAKKQDPKFWLRFGPGKDGGNLRGWGPAAKRRARKASKQTDWQPELFALLAEIAERLQDMPEARQVILDVMDRHRSPSHLGGEGLG